MRTLNRARQQHHGFRSIQSPSASAHLPRNWDATAREVQVRDRSLRADRAVCRRHSGSVYDPVPPAKVGSNVLVESSTTVKAATSQPPKKTPPGLLAKISPGDALPQ